MAKGMIGALALGLLVAACTQQPADTMDTPGGLPATALMVRGGADYDFRATLPAEVVLAPNLARRLIGEAEARRDAGRTAAEADRAQAAESDYPYRPHSRSESWTVQAETGPLLVLSVKYWEYTGGAHGNSIFEGVIHDRVNDRSITFADLFTDPAAAFAALTPAWCEGLNAERRSRRGDLPLEGFNDCPPLADMVVVPNGSPQIFGFKVLVPPYVAGPYAEGSYEVGLDFAPVLPLVKPAYRAAFQGEQP